MPTHAGLPLGILSLVSFYFLKFYMLDSVCLQVKKDLTLHSELRRQAAGNATYFFKGKKIIALKCNFPD